MRWESIALGLVFIEIGIPRIQKILHDPMYLRPWELKSCENFGVEASVAEMAGATAGLWFRV